MNQYFGLQHPVVTSLKCSYHSLLFVTKETLRYQKQVRFPDPTANFVEGQVSRQLSFSGIVTW